MGLTGSVTVTMIRDFQTEPLGADLVVFAGKKRYLSEQEAGRHLAKAVRYAKQHGVYVVTDRLAAANRLGVALLSSKGEVEGLQCATSLHLSLRADFQTDREIQLFQTPFGKLALCVDVDINAPVYPRLARMQGAQLLISSQYISGYDYQVCRTWSGEWSAAQAANMPVVSVSNLLCAVCAPVGQTDDGSGFLLLPQNRYPATVLIPQAAMEAPEPRQPSAQLWQTYFSPETVHPEPEQAPAEPEQEPDSDTLEEIPALYTVEQPVEPMTPVAAEEPPEKPEQADGVGLPDETASLPAMEQGAEAEAASLEAQPEYDAELMRELGLEEPAPEAVQPKPEPAAGQGSVDEIDRLLRQLDANGGKPDPEINRYLSRYVEVEP